MIRKTIESRHWIAAMIGVAWAVVALAYWGTATTLVTTWFQSATYNHCLLVVPIAAYLLWQSRRELADAKLGFSARGLLGVVLCGLAWWAGALLSIRSLEFFAFVGMLIAITYALLGADFFRIARFPLLFLLFAVPIGDFLIDPLMDLTAAATVRGLLWSGVPVYRDGMFFSTPNGDFEVAEACSGIRYLIATLVVGVLFSHLMFRSTRRKLIFLGVAFVVPIVANWIRAYGIVMLAHYSDMTIAVGVDHLIYGWVFFGLVMFLILWLGSRFREDVAAPTERRSVDARAGGLLPLAVVGTLMVALLPAVSRGWVGERLRLDSPAAGGVPIADSAWVGPLPAQTSWQPRFPGAERRWLVDYRRADDARVTLFVARYTDQRSGAELASYDNRFYDESWREGGGERNSTPIDLGKPATAARLVLNRRTDTLVVWTWYWVGGDVVRTPSGAKLRGAWELLKGRRGAEYAIAIAAGSPIGGPPPDAVIEDFLSRLGAQIELCALSTDEKSCAGS